MHDIQKYFPDLTPLQISQFEALVPLYKEWNEKINVISRKDIENLYEHHILHSLGIAKVVQFKSMCEILDVGTGGGFPGIPLAIMFPETKFTLVDSIGKKIKVVNAVVEALDLKNVKAFQARAEMVDGKFDFVVSRAVTTLEEFYGWVKGKISKIEYHPIKNGILYLKGGDLASEINPFGKRATVYELQKFFEGEFFETKKVVHISF